jgi:hypothetical protein
MHQPLRRRPTATRGFLDASLHALAGRDLRRRHGLLDLHRRQHILGLLQRGPVPKQLDLPRRQTRTNRHGPPGPARVLRRSEQTHGRRQPATH